MSDATERYLERRAAEGDIDAREMLDAARLRRGACIGCGAAEVAEVLGLTYSPCQVCCLRCYRVCRRGACPLF